MTNSRNLSSAETRKQRLLREALVDVQALVPLVSAADGFHSAQADIAQCRPDTATMESTIQAIHDHDEVKFHRAIGTAVPAAILIAVASSLMTIGAQAPLSTARAQPATAAIHAVPDASTVFDASAAVEPLPPTF